MTHVAVPWAAVWNLISGECFSGLGESYVQLGLATEWTQMNLGELSSDEIQTVVLVVLRKILNHRMNTLHD